MGARICRSAKAWQHTAGSAEARWQAALRKLDPDAPELFSDRQEDAVEVEGILRDFERAHDAALGVERYA